MRAVVALLILIMGFGCNQKTEHPTHDNSSWIEISGQLSNGENTLVTVDLMGATAFSPVDSVRCDNMGRFALKFPGTGMNYYAVKYTDHGYVTIIAEPGDRITLHGDSKNLYPYEIEGSASSSLVAELARAHNEVLNELGEISEESQMIVGMPDYADKKIFLNAKFDSITDAFHQYSKHFINSNAASPAILIALYNQFGPGLPVFHPLKDLKMYQFADSVLYERFPENEAVRSLHSQLAEATQQLRNQQRNASLEKGEQAPDFVIETIKGEKYALNESRGKYVLLQFWASWSRPSIDENRFLRSSFQQLKDKDFIIVQVSLDSERVAWEKEVKDSEENWIHVSDLKRWESAVANLYRIERIPANFLIDPNGKIVEMDIFGEELTMILEQYIQ